MENKYSEVMVYSCNFCGKNYADLSEMELHLEECTYNFIDHHSCLTCEHAVVNLVPPYGKSNDYKSQRLLEVVGNKTYLTCDKGIYSGKLTEDKLMRENKQCYEGITEFKDFKVAKDNEWNEYKDLLDDIGEEQDEIDANIERLKREQEAS